ncbi:MAG TPA: hypothetical protein VFP87_11665 [Chitinophagaceae bacterium]|nr:hypothetical protein [Chitinophagaceae bacterium]
MNNSAPLQSLEDKIIIRPLAPVIPMKSVPNVNDKLIRKVSKARAEGTPLFYDKPIYKSKKYDLL